MSCRPSPAEVRAEAERLNRHFDAALEQWEKDSARADEMITKGEDAARTDLRVCGRLVRVAGRWIAADEVEQITTRTQSATKPSRQWGPTPFHSWAASWHRFGGTVREVSCVVVFKGGSEVEFNGIHGDVVAELLAAVDAANGGGEE